MGDQREAGQHNMRSAYPIMGRIIHAVLVARMVSDPRSPVAPKTLQISGDSSNDAKAPVE